MVIDFISAKWSFSEKSNRCFRFEADTLLVMQPLDYLARSLSFLRTLGLLILLSNAYAGDPQVVSVGKGSYAEFPPNPDPKLTEFLKANIHLDPSMKGQPIPTNKWWTNLLDRGFGGNMWAYPLVIKPVQEGVQVYYPTKWQDNGHEMDQGQPITVSGKVKVTGQSNFVVMADFEGQHFPAGWQTTGTAFGDGPSNGPVPGETPVSDFMGKGLANSAHGGDGSTGTLLSPHFTINKPFIHFLIGGGRNPNDLYVALFVDGKQVRKETGENSERLKWKTWDVSEFMNHDAQIVAVDNATGGWGHILLDQVTLSSENKPSHGAPDAFSPADATAAGWGDWTVKMRLEQNAGMGMDATFGRGLPYVWFETKGITPRLGVTADATVLDDKGQPLNLPVSASHIVIRQDDRLFAVFAPDNSTWTRDVDHIVLTGAAGDVPYLVVAGLPDISQIGLFAQYAYAVPRQSLFTWKYDPAAGQVVTDWKLVTQALQGTNLDTIQGWLPHHYRDTVQSFSFIQAEYATPRGKMKCVVGHEFQIAWNFNGIAPMPPAPKEIADVPHPFSLARMKGYLADYVDAKASKQGKERYGGDTYWGGKDLVQYAMYAEMAKQLGDEDDHQKLLGAARDALTDWFTYTPGETSQYFARYDNWKAMIGFKSSYGSENFTDNHFHYGYFTLASALVAMDDPQFCQDYGPMARLVAKQYANWDRTDTNFPYLRTFDCWAGHSYAGGTSSPGGNNQESSSEAMQSWTGLFLLGAALNDKEMLAAGAMGWSIEESAVQEYWNDYHGWKDPSQSNLPPNYGHTIVGIMGDGGMGYGTFFNGEPRFIYGIQWLPISTGLYYLGKDPVFNRYQFDSMMKDQIAKKGKFTFSDLKADWGDVTLGYLQFGDPDATAAQFDDLWDANDEIARSKNIAGLVYYFIHADRQLGPVAWDCHTNLPSSMVFQAKDKGQLTVVAWNVADKDTICTVYRENKALGTVTIPSRILTTVSLKVAQ